MSEPVFTDDQKRQITGIVKTWFVLKCEGETYFRQFVRGPGLTPEILANKILVDLDHSALWRRLLNGEDPSPEPPK